MSVYEATLLIIHAKHGWAVAEQFQDTFNGDQPFEDQNPTALNEIRRTVSDLVYGSIFNERKVEELEDYNERLTEWFVETGAISRVKR